MIQFFKDFKFLTFLMLIQIYVILCAEFKSRYLLYALTFGFLLIDLVVMFWTIHRKRNGTK